ncbi:MAG: Kiwa anti-phage protein KwaB-like domain-containing protein [Patescibacteria group bacterium]
MEETKAEPTDIFLWANQTDAVKNELRLELFVFSKNYTPYAVNLSKALDAQARAMFILDLVNTVNFGAGTGMSVRDFELSEAEENVLLRTELEKVGRAETLIHLIEKQRNDIVQFSETEHEFKRIKGLILKVTRPDGQYFYVTKAVQQSNVLPGAISWQLSGDTFAPFEPEVGVKLPSDNQVLIIGKDIFVFNQPKFEKLFQYEYKKQLLADQKVEEILAAYNLSLPEGVDLQMLVRDKPGIVNKLQKLEVGGITQEQAIEHADTMQLDLMTDDKQAIIIMDGRDLDMFVNLINEDYITSELTGKRYVIKSKKLLDEAEGEPPRG